MPLRVLPQVGVHHQARRGAGQFDVYPPQAKKDSPDAQLVSGIETKAIYFGFNLANLAVQYKSDLFVVQTRLGKTTAEKMTLAKAVTAKVIHL